MVIKSQGDWIDHRYQVLNSFPFVIGVLYYTEVETEEKVKQTRFIHALDLKKFAMTSKENELLQRIPERDQAVFFPLQDVFIEDQILFQVYERLEGYLLAHYIKKHFPIGLKEVLTLGKQTIDHLLQLYANDQFAVVHPQNLIISKREKVRFLYGGPSGLLPKGMMMPQEKQVEMLYDSYGVGVLIYQMLTGKSPISNGLKIPRIHQYVVECPQSLDELVMRSLSFDMVNRPSMEEFRKGIEQLINER